MVLKEGAIQESRRIDEEFFANNARIFEVTLPSFFMGFMYLLMIGLVS